MMLPLRLAHREVNRQEFEPHRLRNTMDRNINIKINIKKRREKREGKKKKGRVGLWRSGNNEGR